MDFSNSEDVSDSQLEEILGKTGFPLELEVAAGLERLKWFVSNNAYFYDPDGKKAREVDIIAFHDPPHIRSDPACPIGFYPVLLCECKKSTNYEWVFFSRTSRPYLLEGEPTRGLLGDGQIFDGTRLAASREGTGKVSPMSLVATLIPIHYSSFERQASTYCEVKRNAPSGQIKYNQMRDAIYKTIKACIYYQERSADSAAHASSSYFPIEVTFLAIECLSNTVIRGGKEQGFVRFIRTYVPTEIAIGKNDGELFTRLLHQAYRYRSGFTHGGESIPEGCLLADKAGYSYVKHYVEGKETYSPGLGWLERLLYTSLIEFLRRQKTTMKPDFDLADLAAEAGIIMVKTKRAVQRGEVATDRNVDIQ